MLTWTLFRQELWSHQPLPPERKLLLVRLAPQPDRGYPERIAVGYLRYAAGDKDSPQFIIPGIGGRVIAWCDCLQADFD